jgi:hypothetical protein
LCPFVEGAHLGARAWRRDAACAPAAHLPRARAPPVLVRSPAQLSNLGAALPCHFGSAVAVRVDAQCADLLRALIFGADGTPYAGGAFLFDICACPRSQ